MKKIHYFSFLLFTTLAAQAQDNALFTVDHQKGCGSLTVQVTDLSTGGNGSPLYTFGDGQMSFPPNSNPTHTYSAVGTFTLKQILPISGIVIDPQTGNPVGYVSYSIPITVVNNAPLDVRYEIGMVGDIILHIHDTRFDSYEIDFGDGKSLVTVSRDVSGITDIPYTYENWFGVEFQTVVKGKFTSGLPCSQTDAVVPITAYVTSTVSKENTNVILFPNPLKQGEQLHTQTGNFKVHHVTIYNTIGNNVLELHSNTNDMESIDVSALQPGLYTIQLINSNNEFTYSKFIVK